MNAYNQTLLVMSTTNNFVLHELNPTSIKIPWTIVFDGLLDGKQWDGNWICTFLWWPTNLLCLPFKATSSTSTSRNKYVCTTLIHNKNVFLETNIYIGNQCWNTLINFELFHHYLWIVPTINLSLVRHFLHMEITLALLSRGKNGLYAKLFITTTCQNIWIRHIEKLVNSYLIIPKAK